jgi:hypothetical protein
LKPIDRERPKALGAPAGVTVLPNACEFRPARSPLTTAGPLFNCVSVVLHWIYYFYLILCQIDLELCPYFTTLWNIEEWSESRNANGRTSDKLAVNRW